eukprot:13525893-Heterocapsa_arctica.AAC.1
MGITSQDVEIRVRQGVEAVEAVQDPGRDRAVPRQRDDPVLRQVDYLDLLVRRRDHPARVADLLVQDPRVPLEQRVVE